MKFLITGALNRPSGPRAVVLAAVLVFALFEALTAFLLLGDAAPADTVVLVLEEIHMLVFFRGLEALFLSSVIMGLQAAPYLKRAFPLALFGIPLVAALLALLAVLFPWLGSAARYAAWSASFLVMCACAFVAWKMYAR